MSLHGQAAEQEVGFAGIGLRGEQAARGDVHEDAVDIRKLLPLRVDAVVVGIALEDEAVRRRRVRHAPGLQRRQVRDWSAPSCRRGGCAAPTRISASASSPPPRARALSAYFSWKLLEVMRGAEDARVARAGELRQEARVWLAPMCSGPCARRAPRTCGGCPSTSMNSGMPAGRQLLVLGNVLPVVAEVLGGERVAVRPAVAFAQREGEDPVASRRRSSPEGPAGA